MNALLLGKSILHTFELLIPSIVVSVQNTYKIVH